MKRIWIWMGLWSAGTAWGQSTVLLNDDEINLFANELSGDRSVEHIRALSRWHRDSGMDGYFKAAEVVVEAATAAGLEDVRFVEQKLDQANYNARHAELWMVEPMRIKLADLGDHAVILADGSHSVDTTAEVVWIGDADESVLGLLNVSGKIVLTTANAAVAAQNAVWTKGALGVITYATSEGRSPLDFPDQIAWTRLPKTPDGKKGTFAFSLSPRRGETLRAVLQGKEAGDYFAMGKKIPAGRIVVHAKVVTDFGKTPGRTGFVEAWIRGTGKAAEQIVLTAHLQEEQGSANDDGSGCGNLIEIGRTFKKLIDEGKIRRPVRDLRFWWTDEIYSEYEWFKENPDEPKKMLVNLHQDMVGARQSIGSRIQHLIHAPHSRRSYLDALFDDIGTYVIQTNTAFLSASRAGDLPRPYTRPVYATRGSREGYHAAFVPYFGSSDNMCFVEGVIGVPAVALINWDDYYIHSTDDDLWQIDATQLKRNAFIVAALAYYLGSAGKNEAQDILAVTFGFALRRLARDAQTALQLLRHNPQAWKDAKLLMDEALERERRALRSVADVSKLDRALNNRIFDAEKHLREQYGIFLTHLRRDLLTFEGGSIIDTSLTVDEANAQKKIPENVKDLKTYFTRRESVKLKTGLHPIMKQEVFNFVDGKRTYYDIFKAVRAESLSEGEWYYGSVALADVVRLLDAAVEAGVMTLK